jgi:hypothetical protein
VDSDRQRQPVTVILEGASEDIAYWKAMLMRRVEANGDLATVAHGHKGRFTIYPHAVND